MTSPTVAERFADVLQAVEDRHWGLPAITLDGELVEVEWFSAWGIIDAVEGRLQTRRQSAQEANRHTRTI